MNNTKLLGLILNLILYVVLITPIIFLIFNKKIYKTKKSLVISLIFVTILEIFFSILIYCFAKNFFSFFIHNSGIVNYATYASKIIFISSCLCGLKFLIPAYLFYTLPTKRKKTTILFLSKIVVNIIFIFVGYKLSLIKGALYSLSICDLIYYTIYIILFIKSK